MEGASTLSSLGVCDMWGYVTYFLLMLLGSSEEVYTDTCAAAGDRERIALGSGLSAKAKWSVRT